MTDQQQEEKMYLISEEKLNRFEGLLKNLASTEIYRLNPIPFDLCSRDVENVRARGPVSAQRKAPATDITINAMEELLRSAKKWNRECIAVQSIVVIEEIERIKKLTVSIQAEHDTALIAQERKKWEGERDQKYVLTLSALREISADVELKDYRKSCIHDLVCQWLCTAGNCPFHVALDRNNTAIAAQARKDVLKEVVPIAARLRRESATAKKWINTPLGISALINEMDVAAQSLESLRAGQEHEP